MKVIHKRTNTILLDSCQKADTVLSRMKGLLGRDYLLVYEGLWIVPCNSVHSFFMKMPIDVIFLDKNEKIIKIISPLEPWQMTIPVWSARSVLEIPKGLSQGLQLGDQLCFV